MLPQHIASASRRAAEIYKDSGAKTRVEKDGYTRVDPFMVAGKHGIPVLLRPMDKLLGAFIRDEVSGILVNSERPAGLIHMTCAHELGHYFMGHDTTADDSMTFSSRSDRRELEADWFAYQLLAPRALIANVMRRKGLNLYALSNPLVMYQFSLRLGVSYSAAAWSMARQRLMSEDAVRNLLTVQPAEIKKALLGQHLYDVHKDVWLLDESDRESVLEPRTEDQVLVHLRSNAAAGYLWSLDELASEGFQVRPIPSNSEISKDTPDIAFGRQRTVNFLVTHSEAVGSLEGKPKQLSMSEVRPWLKNSEPSNKFETKAQFEHIESGLTYVAKQQLLKGALAA